ncbi:MAG: hypothetical protein AAGD38_14905 [Acidobacteriota bacterium]
MLSSPLMAGERHGPIRLLTLALVGFLLAVPALADDYRSWYKEGIEAFDDGDWQTTAQAMRKAIGEQPTAGERLRLYGTRFVSYLPYFHLGVAEARLGRCDEALAAFDEVERQDTVSGDRASQMRGLRDRCLESTTASPPIAPPPPSPPPPTTSGSTSSSSTSSDAAESATTESDTRLTASQARAQLQFERTREALDALEALRREPGTRSLMVANPRITQRFRLAVANLAETRTLLARGQAVRDAQMIDRAANQAAELESLFRELARRVREEQTKAREESTPSNDAPRSAEAPTPPATPSDEPRAEQPPTLLYNAAVAFFRADYQGTLSTLDNASFEPIRAMTLVYLLRAAAAHALWRESGGEADDLHARVIAEAAAARALSPELEPSPEMFSPAFLDFYDAAQNR